MENSEHINSLLQQDKYQEVINIIDALPDAAKDKATRAVLAQCHYRLGNFEESVKELTQALAEAPEEAQLYSDRGISYFMMGNRANSLQDFNKAQELEPMNPYRYSSRAYVKDAFRDTKGAIEDYQKAIELDPEDAIAYNNLGLLLEKVGYQKEAQQHFARADQIEGIKHTLPATETTARKQAETAPAKDKRTPLTISPKPQMTAGFLGSTIKSIFTTRKGFQEFLQYWLGKQSDR